MTTAEATAQLTPFAIGIYSDKPQSDVAPTPLLDPYSLQAAYAAYDAAANELRTRSRTALRPATRHTLAKKILGFAIFGERDTASLKDRALKHFP